MTKTKEEKNETNETNEKKIKWKDTLNLPRTAFPMKAQLNRKEPQILKQWEEINIYEKIKEKRKDAELYILHDGPPYANGNLHLGHALNKILKDFVVKTKNMEGFLAPYVPGWIATACPSRLKSKRNWGKRRKICPSRLYEKPAANTRKTLLIFNGMNLSGWE